MALYDDLQRELASRGAAEDRLYSSHATNWIDSWKESAAALVGRMKREVARGSLDKSDAESLASLFIKMTTELWTSYLKTSDEARRRWKSKWKSGNNLVSRQPPRSHSAHHEAGSRVGRGTSKNGSKKTDQEQ